MESDDRKKYNFVERIVHDDIEAGRIQQSYTRFPPEPNGYLHIGHGKSVCLNFGIAETFNGKCNLRFDDTNPEKEEEEYMEAIKEDIKWLGFEWTKLCYASDYFDTLYNWAIDLVKTGKAYVDHQTAEEIRLNRGTLKAPGKESEYRNRSVDENLELFENMKNGKFEEGECVLRAKIDMASPNINMRDPILYRIIKKPHYRTGDKWCIYPMYDFAHGYEDAIEGITHSVCTLEFEDHRPLYDWFLDNVDVPSRPHQYEFARLNLSYTVMSKRLLHEIVSSGIVSGWDDPRMPTLCGLRRRGFTPLSIRKFCSDIGLSKANSLVDYEFLEAGLRDELNSNAPRGMAVLRPLKVVITNYPEDKVEMIEAEVNPENPEAGKRTIPFSKVVYIESTDFMENPPKKYFRLYPGNEVRLKYAYYITCEEVIKDENGNITELRCKYDPESRGGGTPDGRRVRGTIQWVSAEHAVKSEIRLYDKLFTLKNMSDMEEGKTYEDYLNPDSLVVLEDSLVEPMLAEAVAGESFQFLRHGYFSVDKDSTKEKPIFNRTVALKDSWAKMQAKNK